jgi:NAD(P)-dependent dehydrogenase (short-subunit alcohol dehydrogenase family)
VEELEGRVAFVTGGASGIGLGIAQACLEAGMHVVAADLREDHLAAAVTQLGDERAHALQVDVTDRAALVRAREEAERLAGPVDVLVNNAGVGILGPVAEAGYDDWDWGLGVNLGGVVNGIQTFLPGMRERGRGHIVNVSSMAAVVPIPNASIYITAKAAVMGLSESIRSELAPEGVGVSILFPGPVKTNIRDSLRTRPEHFRGDTGYAERERPLPEGDDRDRRGWMDPLECGRRTVDGIRRDDLYILTHPEFRAGARERTDALLRSFPDEPEDPVRHEAFGFFLRNPMYADVPPRGA